MPRLRFPGFEGAWSAQILRDAFAFIQNNTLPRSRLSTTYGKVRDIHYGDILVKFGAVLDFKKDDVPFIKEQSNSFPTRQLRDGDIILADTAEDEAVGKAVEVLGLGNKKAEAGLHTIACRPFRKYEPCFMGYYFNSPSYHRQLMPLMQGIKVLSLSKSQVAGTTVRFPVHEVEQRKIALFLAFLDSRITAQRKLVELLKKHKRGVIEQIFGRRLSIGDNPEKWEIVKLRDLFKKVARRNRDGIVKNVITNSAEYGLIPQRDFFDKSIAVDGNTDGYYVIRTGDFVYNPRKSIPAPFGPFNHYTGVDDGII